MVSSGKRQRAIVILADAFRHDYITEADTPFLHSVSVQCPFVEVTPSIGFCERTELFTGIPNSVSGLYGAFTLNSSNSPYKYISVLLNFLNMIGVEKNRFLNKLIRRSMWEVTSHFKNSYHPVGIPFDKLPIFSLAEDCADGLINSSSRSIFKLLSQNDYRVDTSNLTSLSDKLVGSDEDRCANVISSLEKYDVHFLYLGDVDKFGHGFGPSSNKFKHVLFEFDKAIWRLCNRVHKHDKDIKIFFVGDHGMTDVIGTIDPFTDTLNKIEGLPRGSYEYFIDSTSVRIWLQSDSLKSNCNNVADLFYGINNQRLRWVKASSGDINKHEICITCMPGYIYRNDFFQTGSNLVLGMHGYDPKECEDMKGIFGFWDGHGVRMHSRTDLKLHEVYDEILGALVDLSR